MCEAPHTGIGAMALDQHPGATSGASSPDDGATCLPNPGWLKTEIATIMSSAKYVYTIADNHAQTVPVCIDRLHELGANEQLKVLTGRLQKLAVRAEPGDLTKELRPARAQAPVKTMRPEPSHVNHHRDTGGHHNR